MLPDPTNTNTRERRGRGNVLRLRGWWRTLLFLSAAVMLALLIVPVVSLIWRTVTLSGGEVPMSWTAVWTAVRLSLVTTAVSTGSILLLGTPPAFLFARYDFPGRRLLSLLVEIPIVMPPVVAGLALLTAFGRQGLVGQWLAAAGIAITFDWPAVVLAQIFVAAPFYIRTAQTRFAALPRDLEEAAAVDGAGGRQTFWYIILPLSRRAMLMGLLLSWARALGEFGATILFAGNLAGRTQTMPLLVYSALERDLRAAFVAALVLLGLAVSALLVARWLGGLDDLEAEG